MLMMLMLLLLLAVRCRLSTGDPAGVVEDAVRGIDLDLDIIIIFSIIYTFSHCCYSC